MPPKVLISAGEASGDRYAALLTQRLRRLWPDADFFGCTGERMRAEGVRTVVDAQRLAVVGLVEVLAHLPRIYSEYRKLLRAADETKPDLAILTDSPDFHLPLARQLKRRGVPVICLVAPQVWAWRRGRLPGMRRHIDRLLCIFPFEEEFFRGHGIAATYIGHPLTRLIAPSGTRADFFRKHRLPLERPLVTVLPGSRKGEAARHLGPLLDAVERIHRDRASTFLLPASSTTGGEFFRERIGNAPVMTLEGETWDAIAHADVAMAASGTVTVEAALLGAPMVTFYKVTRLSWWMGKFLVDVPFYTMVNLVAGREVVTELMQGEMTGQRLAAETLRLLRDDVARDQMRRDLAEVSARLMSTGNPMDRAAEVIEEMLEGKAAHVS